MKKHIKNIFTPPWYMIENTRRNPRWAITGYFDGHQHYNAPIRLWHIVLAVCALGITREVKIRREW